MKALNLEEEQSFHLNLRRNKQPYEHEEANYNNIRHHLAFEGKKVLDIGCGHGLLLSRIMEKNDVYGVDFIPDNPYKIKKKVVDLEKERLPFRKETFDVIVCSNVLEHITKPLSILRQIDLLLKKGGKTIIVVPNEYTLRNRVDVVLGKPLVSHQIDSFGHKYMAGVNQWRSFISLVFPRYKMELYKQRERGIVGKVSDLLSPLFPTVNKDQIGFIVEKE